MKKKLAIVASIILLLLGGLKLSEELFGVEILPEMPAITPRQKQLQYLKDHDDNEISIENMSMSGPITKGGMVYE